jgi:hypothetical protein
MKDYAKELQRAAQETATKKRRARIRASMPPFVLFALMAPQTEEKRKEMNEISRKHKECDPVWQDEMEINYKK